jgi:hypothetical protein
MKIQLMVGNESNIGSRIGIPGGNTFNRSQNRGRGGNKSIRGRRGGRGAGGRGRGGQRGQRGKIPTAEELDAELDAYTNKM